MAFDVAAESYGRFMGRYSEPLARAMLAAVPPPAGLCLDVGCGPGALTAELVERLGADRVRAVDPSAPFVASVRDRFPGLDVQQAGAESLPFADDTFGSGYAALVVHFMSDPVAGLAELNRVVTSGGPVTATVWDFAARRSPLSTFWTAAVEMDAGIHDESDLPGVRPGHLVALAEAAGLVGIEQRDLTIARAFESFEEWWEPYTLGVGPAGDLVATLGDDRREELRERCRAALPTAPFTVEASALFLVSRAR